MKFKFYTILAVICLLFPSCNSDDDLDTQNIVEKSNNRDQAYEVIDESRLSSKIPTIYNQLKEVNNISINSQEHSPLEVILDEVNMIEHDSITTYTFQVVNYDHFGSVPAENLIYTKYYNGDGFFSLLRYDLRKSDYPSVIDGSFQDLDNFVGLVGYTRELNANAYLYESFSTTLPGPGSDSECFTFVNANTEMCPENIHTFTEVENGKCKVADPGDLGPPVYEVITDLNCLESGGSSGGDGDGSGGNPGDGNPGGSMFPDPSYSGYAPGGGGFEDPGDGDPGDGSNYTLPGLADANGFSTTYPNLSFEYNAFYDFYTGLDAATQQHWNDLSFDDKNEIQDFLEDGDYSSDAVDFIMEVIEVLNENPDTEVDFEEKIINELTGKALNVYNDLKSSSTGFRDGIKKFETEFPVSHLKFDMGDIGASRGKTIAPNSSSGSLNSPNFVITVRLNNNNTDSGVDQRPDLLVAKTIAHEVIHAEMFRKLLSVLDNGGTITGVTRQDILDALDGDFPGMYDYYRRHKNWQHQQMATHYRETLASILQEFDTGNAVPDNQQPDQLYMDLSWEGLRYPSIDTWSNLPETEKERIDDVITDYIANN